MKVARELWFEGQLHLDPDKLVFIDESGASTKMARLSGRALRGERCRASVPHGHWKTTTTSFLLRVGAVSAGRPEHRAVYFVVGDKAIRASLA